MLQIKNEQQWNTMKTWTTYHTTKNKINKNKIKWYIMGLYRMEGLLQKNLKLWNLNLGIVSWPILMCIDKKCKATTTVCLENFKMLSTIINEKFKNCNDFNIHRHVIIGLSTLKLFPTLWN
jgi:hypothetical protein